MTKKEADVNLITSRARSCALHLRAPFSRKPYFGARSTFLDQKGTKTVHYAIGKGEKAKMPKKNVLLTRSFLVPSSKHAV
jgi:hypothetical protein